MPEPANRKKTGNIKARDAQGRFIKGASGNPSGRPMQPADVKIATRELLSAATVPAVQILVDTMKNDNIKPELRVKCAEIILDRVMGKSVQPLETTIKSEGFDWSGITTDELRRLAALDESDNSAGGTE